MTKLQDVLKKNPPTTVLTSRCDVRSLATLASFWQTQGEHVRSQSELVRLSLEFLTELVVRNFKSPTFQNTQSAKEYLQIHGILPQTVRNFKTLTKQVQKESMIAEGFTVDPQEIKEVRSLLDKKLKQDSDRRDEELKDQLNILKTKPEGGIE